MPIPSILRAFYATPLAIQPEKLEAIRALLLLRAAGGEVPPERVAEVVAARRPDGVVVTGKVAVLPVFGVLAQRVGMAERASGGVSTEEIGATLDGLAADRQVSKIVMAFDSPGGSVYGVQELADKVRAVAQQKKVVAVADSVAASAAYWLASQASELYVTPGGQVGSIGVLAAHQDTSKAEEQAGLKTTYVTSSPHKAEHAPEAPLSPEALAELQAKVNHYHALFVKAVARGRNATEARVNADFGQGRMVTARDAVTRGMADGVATLEQVLRRLGAEGGSPATAAAARARAVELED